MSEQANSGGGQSSAPASGTSTPTQTTARSTPPSVGTPASTPTPPTASPANNTPTATPSPQPQTPVTVAVSMAQQFLQQQQQGTAQQATTQQQIQQAQQQQTGQVITPINISSGSSVLGTNSGGLVSQSMTAIRASLPQVQVIQSPFIHQQAYIQQQLMLQNAAVQAAMQAHAINPQMSLAVQGRQSGVGTSPKSPGIISPQSVTSQAAVKTTSSSGNGKTVMTTGVKQVSVQQQVAAPMIGGKPIMQRQNQQPLVIGQLAGFPLQRTPNSQTGKTGVISNQPVTSLGTQTKTASINSTLMSQSQLLSNATQLRITSNPSLATNAGQLMNTQGTMIATPAMINQLAMASLHHQNLSMAPQTLMAGTQGTTMINNQPVYIRTTGPITSQLVNNLQQVAAPAKQKDNTKPQQPNLQPKATVASTRPLTPSTTISDKVRTIISGVNPPQTQPRQVNRVTGIKKTVGTKTTMTSGQVGHVGVQARPLIQPKPGGIATVQQQPTMVVTPKPQQPQPAPQPQPTTQPQQLPKVAVSSPLEANRPINILPKPSLTTTTPTVTTSTATNGQVQALLASSHAQILRSTVTNPIMSTSEMNISATIMPLDKAVKEEPKTEPMEVDKPPEVKKDMDGAATGLVSEKQKAIVKPHILTHFIEGFVIQESAEPFQVQRSSILNEMITTKLADSEPRDTDNSDMDKDSMDDETKLDENVPTLKCEFCGKVDYAHKFRRSKRFCSMACAKRYNVGCSRRLGLFKSQNAGKQKRKKKEVPAKKGWKRTDAGRVTRPPLPMQRLQEAMQASGDILTDSQESEDSAMVTGEDDSGDNADPMPSNVASVSHESMHPNFAAAAAIAAQNAAHNAAQNAVEKSASAHPRNPHRHSHGNVKGPVALPHLATLPQRTSVASSATTGSSPMDTMSDESSQSSGAPIHDSAPQSPPRSPPILQPEVQISPEPPSSPIRRHPSLWTVMDVYDFIRTLPGCSPYADEFKQQEIDGQALMLLKEDHLMSAMNMKLGPALKICNKISSLREEPR